jgi:dienelactone hydrolase
MPLSPAQLALVVDVPDGRVDRTRLCRIDLYVAPPADQARPAVLFVPGAYAAGQPLRPPDWPAYSGYGRLAAQHGVVAAVADLPMFHWPVADATSWAGSADDLAEAVDELRARPEVDADRIALWAFSGGALLLTESLADPPPWLRAAVLSYPVVYVPTEPAAYPYANVRPGCPTALIRVGREEPARLAEVDRLLERVGERITRIGVPDGRHGFDVLDDSDESRQAIDAALAFVVDGLTDQP